MAGKTVLVLGAGIGGLVAAHELRRRLSVDQRVILIEREPAHQFQSSFLWVMMGWREPAAVSRPLDVLSARGIEFRQSTVETIDPASRSVVTAGGTVEYDYLVVALGAQLDHEAIPELALAGSTPYTLAGAQELRQKWQHQAHGSVAVVIADLPFKCPAAPYEAALLLDAGFREQGVRDQIDLTIYTPEAQPMAVAGVAVGAALEGMLESRGILYRPGQRLNGVDPERRQLRFDGTAAEFDLLVYVPPHRSPTPVEQSALAGPGGWIPVDARTMRTSDERVYAIGDVSAVALANGMMLPKAGVFAHGEAVAVAGQIAAEIGGGNDAPEFSGWGGCFIEMGAGKAAYGSGDFLASPDPRVTLHAPTRARRMAKLAFERAWLTAIGGSGRASDLAWRILDQGPQALERPWLWRWP